MQKITISKAKVHDIIIHAIYLIAIATFVFAVEMSLHHLNEEFFLAWVCADVRGAIVFIVPVNDEKLAPIRKIKDSKKRHAMVIVKEFVTIAFVAIISYNITEWFFDREIHGWIWWAFDILVIMLLWVAHYYLIEMLVRKYRLPNEGDETMFTTN